MKRGKITLECSCGNTKEWSILSDMLPVRKIYYEYKYSLKCDQCGATKTIAKAPAPTLGKWGSA